MRWKLFREYMRILDIVWPLIRDVFPARKPGAGRPPKPMRQVINTILYVLYTGCQWNAVFEDKGDRLCNGKTAHRYHMIWSRSDFYLKLNRRLLLIFDRFFGLEVNWLALDGCTYKAPLALQAVGKNPTDRAKNGTKRSMLVDEHGLVLSFVHSGANVHDSQLLEPTLVNRMYKRQNSGVSNENLCLDAAYVGDICRETVTRHGYIPHIQPRGEEKRILIRTPDYKARRWVVERTNSWMLQFRKLKTRYEKTIASHDGLTHIGCICIILRIIFRKKLNLNPWIVGESKPNDGYYSSCCSVLIHKIYNDLLTIIT